MADHSSSSIRAGAYNVTIHKVCRRETIMADSARLTAVYYITRSGFLAPVLFSAPGIISLPNSPLKMEKELATKRMKIEETSSEGTELTEYVTS